MEGKGVKKDERSGGWVERVKIGKREVGGLRG